MKTLGSTVTPMHILCCFWRKGEHASSLLETSTGPSAGSRNICHACFAILASVKVCASRGGWKIPQCVPQSSDRMDTASNLLLEPVHVPAGMAHALKQITCFDTNPTETMTMCVICLTCRLLCATLVLCCTAVLLCRRASINTTGAHLHTSFVGTSCARYADHCAEATAPKA